MMKKNKIKCKRLPRNCVSLAEQQENRLNNIKKQSSVSKKLFNSKHNVTDFYLTSGVYFLFDKEEIVYIGESQDLLRRICEHFRGKYIFDSFKFSEFKGTEKQRKCREAFLIRKHKPKYNIQMLEIKDDN